MKSLHEDAVEQSMSYLDLRRRRLDEAMAIQLVEWEELVLLESWGRFSRWVCGPDTARIRLEDSERLYKLSEWLLERAWPASHYAIARAMENLRRVLDSFLYMFRAYGDLSHTGESIELVREHKRLSRLDNTVYDRLFREHDERFELISDLMLELTRAVNLVCDRVRESVDETYRLAEGVVIARSGPYELSDYMMHRVEYVGDEREAVLPFPGLEEFKLVRKARDYSFSMVEDR